MTPTDPTPDLATAPEYECDVDAERVGAALLAAIRETPNTTGLHLIASRYGSGQPSAVGRYEWSNPKPQYGYHAVSSIGAKESPVLAELDAALRAALEGSKP